RRALPERCVVDGELVAVTPRGLDFDALGQRIHPAESRIAKMAEEVPASYVAFDLIALGDNDLQQMPFRDRRRLLERLLANAAPPVFVTPTTTQRETALDWFDRFEGAGFDGIMAKPAGDSYASNQRTLLKLKHKRTADAVVGGYRLHKDGNGVGSLLLGLHDDEMRLHHVGVATSFTAARRSELLEELAPIVQPTDAPHPWATAESGAVRMPGALNRWNSAKDMSWIPVRCERVVEISYQHMQDDRLRSPASFVRWRPEREPQSCTYAQLDTAPPAELFTVFDVGK
ncbi:UNVERIFIED_CONTAM: hypothetical protein GTU68_023267, partial [Idotea baltica]|nr:hypothetical protein [Idotea baltica]